MALPHSNVPDPNLSVRPMSSSARKRFGGHTLDTIFRELQITGVFYSDVFLQLEPYLAPWPGSSVGFNPTDTSRIVPQYTSRT
jgi:hypothetical protein